MGTETEEEKETKGRKRRQEPAQAETWHEACDGDADYEKFTETVKRVNTKRFQKIMENISADYRERLIREIKLGQLEEDPKSTILTITLEAQQLRSNIVEHKGEAYRVKSALEDYVEKISNTLRARYVSLLSGMKTETLRKASVDSLTADARTKLRKLEHFILFCDERINDIDQEKWAVKAILDTMRVNESMGGQV